MSYCTSLEPPLGRHMWLSQGPSIAIKALTKFYESYRGNKGPTIMALLWCLAGATKSANTTNTNGWHLIPISSSQQSPSRLFPASVVEIQRRGTTRSNITQGMAGRILRARIRLINNNSQSLHLGIFEKSSPGSLVGI